jgi:hypothetical protein
MASRVKSIIEELKHAAGEQGVDQWTLLEASADVQEILLESLDSLGESAVGVREDVRAIVLPSLDEEIKGIEARWEVTPESDAKMKATLADAIEVTMPTATHHP